MSQKAWGLEIAGPAARDVERLPAKYAAAILTLLPAIAEHPHRLGKPLRRELDGVWSARRGPYRVLYEIDEQRHVVTGVAVAHRSDAYRPR
ncbi:type II toxin-antitoxin system RelE/ParE family toxin [Conexibacter sp. DBS9H8]|uniref:type II toxin-antitoxin system RelE family toxin n=1 Tax=Conexibacter sp. DBS9H8 TaxID=2937801 RepID=UPI00200C2F49|nr:type II toxin-antitoxin system RelE/ParE family toxin [Conexibacter sp. DBS9H8]